MHSSIVIFKTKDRIFCQVELQAVMNTGPYPMLDSVESEQSFLDRGKKEEYSIPGQQSHHGTVAQESNSICRKCCQYTPA